MILSTEYHFRNLPDIPRYVLAVPITTKKIVPHPFLITEFQRAFPGRFMHFLARYANKMCVYRWFDIYRAAPFEFQPHIAVLGLARKQKDKPEFDVVVDVLQGLREWMRIEMPLVKDLCIAMPPEAAWCKVLVSAAKHLYENDRTIRVHLFARPRL